MPEQEETGFKIVDRRASSQETIKEPKPQDKSPTLGEEAKKADTEKASTEEKTRRTAIPEASFLSLVLSLYTEAQMKLGFIPNPLTNKADKDLAQAKYLIDTLGILKDKTRGNLTSEEEQVLADMLFDLRMKYVEGMKT